MKSKKANKKFDFKVFTETGPKTSLITDVTLRIKEASLLLEETNMVAMMRRAHGHCQDPASVTFSVLSLAMHFSG
uniref:Uncharacterized protein n=1 Tax=Brassica oleracea TaxID=3712 RepID=A0A3P6G7D3_BRAOL|nr:unnamed protein product [Brassica oleracea]